MTFMNFKIPSFSDDTTLILTVGPAQGAKKTITAKSTSNSICPYLQIPKDESALFIVLALVIATSCAAEQQRLLRRNTNNRRQQHQLSNHSTHKRHHGGRGKHPLLQLQHTAPTLNAADLAQLKAVLEVPGGPGTPRQIDSDTSCTFCPNNGLPNPEFVIPADDGRTCQTASDYASTLDASESDSNCSTVQLAESFCCPSEEGQAEVVILHLQQLQLLQLLLPKNLHHVNSALTVLQFLKIHQHLQVRCVDRQCCWLLG